MTRHEFDNLQRGDIVRHKLSSEAYVVTANYPGRVTVVRTSEITTPDEWNLFCRACGRYPEDEQEFTP